MSDETNNNWELFHGKGDGAQHPVNQWPAAPPWRDFSPATSQDGEAAEDCLNRERGRNYIATPKQVEAVNAALHLRRPLLLTGKPGTGKSSLAYAIAWELKLGSVLRWPITSRSTLQEGLYRYDAIARLQDANLQNLENKTPAGIGQFLSLGPLGTAFQDSAAQPRVLLIDEIDKSDIDLPNDLLNIFEEGEFEIPELARYHEETASVRLFDSQERREIVKGRVRCQSFPIVVMTSNGEREFPPPLLRRCLRLDIEPPEKDELTRIVKAHLDPGNRDPELIARAGGLIERFLDTRKERGHLANDQLLNAVFLLTRGLDFGEQSVEALEKRIFQTLGDADNR